MAKGLFITFEGPEGCGKTTQAQILSEYLSRKGYKVILTHEPGGTPLGERLRHILLTPNGNELSALCELFLYLADRADHTQKVIKPALNEGKIVICDRFTDATCAYQGYGLGVDLGLIGQLNRLATQQIEPDLTIVLDIDSQLGLRKAIEAKFEIGLKDGDRLEQRGLDFHQRVRQGYINIAHNNPSRVKLITVDDSIEEIQRKIRDYVDELIRVRLEG